MRATRHPRAVVATGLILGLALSAWLYLADAVGYRPLTIDIGAGSGADGYLWRGAVHVHTERSGDASGTVEQVASAAASAGLDFVVVSDHTRAGGGEARVRDGWVSGVLVVAAEEISTTAGHLLALGIPAHRYALGPTPRQAIDDILELGGEPFVAHPAGGEVAWSDGWAGVAGLEVASYSGALHRLAGPQLAVGLLRYLASPAAAAVSVFRPGLPGTDIWDDLTGLSSSSWPRPMAALGSVDAHGPIRILGVPSYEATFRAVSTALWLPMPPDRGEQARRQAAAITEALVAGHSAVLFDAVGAAPELEIHAENRQGARIGAGEVATWEAGWSVHAGVGAPGDYRIELLADGVPVAEADGHDLVHVATRPGTYRVAIYRTDAGAAATGADRVPWVLGNPVYLWPHAAIMAARQWRAPRLPAPSSVDLFGDPGWSAESDATSMSAIALGNGGLRWQLRLPGEGGDAPYAAVTWRPDSRVDWRAAAGLAVRLQAEERWRVGLRVQLMRGNVAETWERIVPAGPASRGAGTRWGDFLALDPSGGYALGRRLQAVDLGDVRAVVLVVTPDLMKPRTEASIEVRQLGPFGDRS